MRVSDPFYWGVQNATVDLDCSGATVFLYLMKGSLDDQFISYKVATEGKWSC